MAITVREALKIPALVDCRVIAGCEGLDRRIQHVTVMDVPNITKWLKGNELLLCAIYVMRDDAEQLVSLVNRANECRVAAIGVKIEHFEDGIPGAMIREADRLRLPIIAIPEPFAWVDVMDPILGEIINTQYARLRRSADLHARFTQLALEGQGLEQIVVALADIIGNSVAITDAAGLLAQVHPSHRRPDAQRVISQLAQYMRRHAAFESSGLQTIEPEESNLPWPVAISAISRSGEYFGHLVCIMDEHVLTPEDVMAVEHATTIAILESLKQQAVDQVKQRFRNSFLYDLLMGTLQDADTIRAHARHVGWDRLGERYGVFIMNVGLCDADEADADTHSLWNDLRDYQRGRDELYSSVNRYFHNLDRNTMLMQLSRDITVLLPLDDSDRGGRLRNGDQGLDDDELIRNVASRAKKHLERNPLISDVSVGIGRVYSGLTELHRAYEEARKALELGTSVWGEASMVHYDDLGVFRILNSADSAELYAFAHEILSPLDAQKDADVLLETMRAFFLQNENVSDTAQMLFVHPNTVRYRLSRIEKCLRLDMSNHEHRMNVNLALKIRKLMNV
ncbi:MAG: PucR family transcriptional regulator ligand-binding domain-containing protein [Bacillota bacterium]